MIDTDNLTKYLTDAFAMASRDGRIEMMGFFAGMEKEFAAAGYREETGGVKSVLIVRLDVVGDSIITTGFVREVRRNYPKAHITFVVSPLVKPLVEFCPYVNDVLAFEAHFNPAGLISMIAECANFARNSLWQRHYDVAFCPQWGSENISGLFTAYFSGARERIGFGHYPIHAWMGNPPPNIAAVDEKLLTKNIITTREQVSEAEKAFYVLTAAGFKVEDTSMELWFNSADAISAKNFIKNIAPDRLKIVLGLGAGDNSRKYPAEQWIEALKEIAKDNVHFIIIGGKSESEDARTAAKNLPADKITDLTGKTTLRETAALIAAADMYMGNDTGVMHMACAAKRKVIVIYREAKDKETDKPGLLSEYRRFPPWQNNAEVLRPEHALDECAENHGRYGGCVRHEAHCIKSVPPEEIVAAYRRLINR